MKPHPILYLLVALATPVWVLAEPRQFTSAGGRQITAELTGYQDGKAQLKLASGKTASVALSSLSEPDREYIDLWATDPSRSVTTSDISMAEYLGQRGYDSIQYTDDHYVMVLELSIAGRSHKFILNTALPYSYLNGSLADMLQLTVHQTNAVLATTGGGIEHISEAKLENFTVGKSLFSQRVFRIANLARTGLNTTKLKVDGVLGFDFLMRNGAILDHDKKTIYFMPPPKK